MHSFPIDGMLKRKFNRTKGQSRGPACVLKRLAEQRLQVNPFAAKRMTDFGQVDADLVSAAGFGRHSTSV